jgi:hypothetical protein
MCGHSFCVELEAEVQIKRLIYFQTLDHLILIFLFQNLGHLIFIFLY